MTAQDAAWSIQVWEDAAGFWHWDVRSPFLRSTGERRTWREAYAMAQSEMTDMRGLEAVTPGGV